MAQAQPPSPPGWYPDPWRQAPLRWWDGSTWTGHVSGPPSPRPQPVLGGPPVGAVVAAEREPARWLRLVLVVEAAVFALQLIAVGAQVRLIIDVIRDDDDFERDLPSWIGAVQIVGFAALAALVLRVIWLMRAAEAGRRLGRPARRSPGLAGAGWVIPVVNLWWPFQDVRALLGPDHPDRSRASWWWGLHLAGQFGVLLVLAAAFGPVALQAAAVAVCALAYAAANVIERDLVAAVLTSHEEAAGLERSAGQRPLPPP